jgi:hypothetical protein
VVVSQCPSLDLLVADDGLYDFDETRNEGKFFLVAIPCDADAPQRLLPVQFMKPHCRHFEAQGRPRDQRNPHTSSNEMEDGQELICFLNDPWAESRPQTKA